MARLTAARMLLASCTPTATSPGRGGAALHKIVALHDRCEHTTVHKKVVFRVQGSAASGAQDEYEQGGGEVVRLQSIAVQVVEGH